MKTCQPYTSVPFCKDRSVTQARCVKWNSLDHGGIFIYIESLVTQIDRTLRKKSSKTQDMCRISAVSMCTAGGRKYPHDEKNFSKFSSISPNSNGKKNDASHFSNDMSSQKVL